MLFSLQTTHRLLHLRLLHSSLHARCMFSRGNSQFRFGPILPQYLLTWLLPVEYGQKGRDQQDNWCLGSGKIDDRATVQAPTGIGRCNQLSVREAQEHSISDCPIRTRVREAQLHIGVDPSPGLRRGCFYMHSNYFLPNCQIPQKLHSDADVQFAWHDFVVQNRIQIWCCQKLWM